MFEIEIPSAEYINEQTNEFIEIKGMKLRLEHSLLSLSKWESKWEKPFLHSDKNIEESLDYVRFMTLTQNVDPLVYTNITNEMMDKINNYIDAKMTATWFNEREPDTPNREIITSEIIYYWMISLNIPVEFEKWHLNRLLTLIKVCSIKNSPSKKMSKSEVMARNRALNKARKAKYNSKG